MKRDKITQSRLKELLFYDPITGYFVWKLEPSYRAKIGVRAGSSDGVYRMIGLDRVRYKEHRLAWLYMYGVWPEEIDHKDMDGTNNSLNNLRPATRSQNMMNKQCPANSMSGIKGVTHWRGLWRARISKNGVLIDLGTYETANGAKAAYIAAAAKMHGEYARTE
jgi:hypothetical protein